MATARRYFVDARVATDRATLGGAQAHHLRHVMRAVAGTEVTLFDGSGVEFCARVATVGRSTVELTIVSRAEIDRELSIPLTLGVALPKAERQRFLVEKTVELGVGRLVPLITEHTAVRSAEQGRGRLERFVIEASKQCGRNHLMQIAPPQRWPDFVVDLSDAARPEETIRWVAHPAGANEAGKRPWEDQTPANPRRIILAIGPEGGLTETEVQLAQQAGWSVADLGPRLLRVETAALVMVALAATRTLLNDQTGSSAYGS